MVGELDIPAKGAQLELMYSHLASWFTVKILHVHNSRNSYIIARNKRSRPEGRLFAA